ncbi:hypothetical protein DESC_770111 [Desulfosarcina cetonica]|nr:hypothetical protein DESC_770111 [Desulfosarcina cetonica]
MTRRAPAKRGKPPPINWKIEGYKMLTDIVNAMSMIGGDGKGLRHQCKPPKMARTSLTISSAQSRSPSKFS